MLFLLQNILFLDRQNHSSFTGVLPAVHKDPLRNKLTAQINFRQNNLDIYTESQLRTLLAYLQLPTQQGLHFLQTPESKLQVQLEEGKLH